MKYKPSYIYFFIILILSYLTIFHNLGAFQIRMWDEALYANNAIDMLQPNINFLVVERHDVPDVYNTKPPFVIWMQALTMKFIGINELAVRLPSAVFAFSTVLLVFFFCFNIIKNQIVGFISALILLSSKGFIGHHIARTGDLDAVLVFWLTLGLFAFLHLVIKKPKKSYYNYLLLSISLIFGFLTKGIAGFFFLPIYVIISLVNKNYFIYKERGLYISAAATIIFCAGYYILRELSAPGYLSIIWQSEILRFNTVVMSWHVRPFTFYIENLINSRFNPFIYILPLSILLPFMLEKQSNKYFLSVYLLIAGIFYLLFISYPSVKLEWYDAPLYPIYSILVALIIVEIINFLFIKYKFTSTISTKYISFAIAILLALKPLEEIIRRNLNYPEEHIYEMEFEGAYLKHLRENYPDIKNITVFKREEHPQHYDQTLFYIRAFNNEHNYKLELKQEFEFTENEIILIHKEEDRKIINEQNHVELINTWRNGSLYKIIVAK